MIKSNALAKRIFAAALSAALLFSVALTGCNNEESSSTDNSNSQSSVSQVTIDDIPDAVKSENYQISLAFVSYMFNDMYKNYYSSWQYYYGFDPTRSLKEQYTPESGSSQTWYDYLLNLVEEQLKQVLVFAEAAKAEGMTLTEEEQKSISDQLSDLSDRANESSKSMEDYIAEQCGPGVTEADLKNYSEIMLLAQKYYKQLSESFTYDDADYDKYYQENTESFQYCDYMSYSFTSTLDENATDDEKKKDAATRKALADELAKCTTQESFENYVRKYLQENPDLAIKATTTSDGETSEPTQEEIDKAIENKISGLLVTKYAYETSSAGGKWLFDDARKKGDTNVFEGETSYTVTLMLKPSYRDESVYKNVRHILIKTESTSSSVSSESSGLPDAEAKAKAEEIYQEWKDGDQTEESFAELAVKYSEDPGSASEGGLYTNVAEGKMTAEFNDWCFDENRKPGDTDIIKTPFGYHIMYFVGNGMPAWKMTADTAMRSNDTYEKYQEMSKTYPVTFNEEALSKLEIIE